MDKSVIDLSTYSDYEELFAYVNPDTKVFRYQFDSMVELIDYLDEAPVNYKIFNEYNLSSNKREKNSWYKTRNLEEAKDLCLKGDNDSVELFNSKIEEVSLLFPSLSHKRNIVEGYYGHRPNVMKYLRSNPRCMYKLERNEIFNVIEIYYNVTSSNVCTSEQLFNRGVATINLVKLLENLGYRVKLNFFELCKTESFNKTEYFYFSLNIKRTDEKISPAICCFPMCNPSFLRRILFRVKETTDFQLERWSSSYGEIIQTDEEQRILSVLLGKDMDKCIMIGDPRMMGIEGDDLTVDTMSLFEKVKINEYIDGFDVDYDQEKKSFTLTKKRK